MPDFDLQWHHPLDLPRLGEGDFDFILGQKGEGIGFLARGWESGAPGLTGRHPLQALLLFL